MTVVTQNPPSPRWVVVFVPPGSQLVGVVGLVEALDAANRFRQARGRAPLYTLRVVGTQRRTPTSSPVVLHTEPAHSDGGVHTLVVSGSLELADERLQPEVRAAVQRLADRAQRVVSVCAGAFVLAELGLLDGRRCTTHWMVLDKLRQRAPKAHVAADAIYTEDGPVLTSAGASAGIDLALHLIAQDAGPRLARAVARALVVFVQRPGGQSQFGTALRLQPGLDDRLQRLVSQVVAEPGADHGVEAMAQAVGMSARNFARVFRRQTGQTPAVFVASARVEAAKRLLSDGDAGLDEVAVACGFRRAETLRRTFQRLVGVTPSDYRRGFAA